MSKEKGIYSSNTEIKSNYKIKRTKRRIVEIDGIGKGWFEFIGLQERVVGL